MNIKAIEGFAKSFKCQKCHQIFETIKQLNQHKKGECEGYTVTQRFKPDPIFECDVPDPTDRRQAWYRGKKNIIDNVCGMLKTIVRRYIPRAWKLKIPELYKKRDLNHCFHDNILVFDLESRLLMRIGAAGAFRLGFKIPYSHK